MSTTANPQFLFLSALIGKPVWDSAGERLGTVRDLIVRLGDERHPAVTGLVVRAQAHEVVVPRTQLGELGARGARLAVAQPQLQHFTRRDHELLLGRDVLDRQLVDVGGQRVIRVNDLQLAGFDNGQGGEYRLVGVDAGGNALLRRLIPARFGGRSSGEVIDWGDVEYLASHAPDARLHLTHERIARLHPVEIARLVDALGFRQGAELIASLDDETAAEALQELTGERGADIVGELDEERAADILEEMNPADAADLLQDLSAEKAHDLLELMEPDDREDLQELLAYPEDTAGGIMTNSFVTVPGDWTAAQVLAYLRTLEPGPDLLYYLYIVPKVGSWQLAGVVSLRDLVVRAAEDTRMDEAMLPASELITVHSGEAAREVARTLATYNLLALPVLDDEGDIVGVVTLDDAIDLILPEDWRSNAKASG